MPPAKPNPKTDWNECPIGFHVSEELKRCGTELSTITQHLTDIKVEIGKLKVKSGIWGAVGATIPIVTGLLLYAVSVLIMS